MNKYTFDYPRLQSVPGYELLSQGVKDLSEGITTKESLLLLISAPRLQRLGFSIPGKSRPQDLKIGEFEASMPQTDYYEHALYRLLQQQSPNAHALHTSLIRRVISFARILEGGRL